MEKIIFTLLSFFLFSSFACKKDYYDLGYEEQIKNNNKMAIEYYTKAINDKPDYFEAYNNRGIAFTDLFIFDKALADFDKAIEIKPNYAKAYYNRGRVHYLSFDLESALNDFSVAYKLGFTEAKYYLDKHGK